MPGTITPELAPLLHVTEHAMPSRSRTATCVVEPSRPDARNASPKPGWSSCSRNSGVRAAWVCSIADTIAATLAGFGPRSSSVSARAIRIPPAEGGGFVRISRPR